MMKRPNMQVTGAKIAQLRRELGLCVSEFASRIEQPVWLILLLENAHIDQVKELIDLLSDHVIDTLLQEIIEVYGVSRQWLTTRHTSPKHPPLPEDQAPQPPLLYLPIMLTAEDVEHHIDDVIAFAFPKAYTDILAGSIDHVVHECGEDTSLLYTRVYDGETLIRQLDHLCGGDSRTLPLPSEKAAVPIGADRFSCNLPSPAAG